MNSEKTDVVVVGAGPAGSSAARILAKAGLETIIIEKKKKIGVPVACGEGITRMINSIDPEIRLRPEHISSKIATMKIVLPNGTQLDIGSRKPHADGFIINRDLYEQFLAEKAEDHGAEIRKESIALSPIMKNGRVQGVVVRDKKNNDDYNLYAKVVIAADGVSPLIAKRAGMTVRMKESEICPCAESRYSGIKVNPNEIEVWFLPEGSMQGYAWVFPKSNSVANVGVGMMKHVLRQKGVNVQDILDDFVKQRFYNQNPNPILKMNGIVPLGTCKTLAMPGLALVGDAGRMVSPVSGAGIENAIKAGIMLGNTISDGGYSIATLKKYEKEYMQKIGKKMKALLYFRKMLGVTYDISPNAILFWWPVDIVKMVFAFQRNFIDLTGGREEEPMISTGLEGKIVKAMRRFI